MSGRTHGSWASRGRGAVLDAVGLDDVERYLSDVERRASRERQKAVRGAARKTLVPAIRSAAPDERDAGSGVTMRRAVAARNGKGGTVLVGPRGGKRGVWFRHITVGGARAHEVGGARAGGLSLSVRFRRTRSGTVAQLQQRRSASRGRAFLGSVARGMHATGPVRHPGRRADPFVQRGTDRAWPAFTASVAESLFSDKEIKS